jgi:hypothetical protein
VITIRILRLPVQPLRPAEDHIELKRRHFRIRFGLLRESALLGLPASCSRPYEHPRLLVNNTLGAYGGDRAITIYGMNHGSSRSSSSRCSASYRPPANRRLQLRRAPLRPVKQAIRVTMATMLTWRSSSSA